MSKRPRSASDAAAATAAADDDGSARAAAAPRYTNRQRVLTLSSRGVTARHRYFLEDLRRLMPHSKKDAKLDEKHNLRAINEMCEVKSCTGAVYLEARRKRDLYMWVTRSPNGPSAKFLVHNLHTMDELRLTGNHALGTRPVLSFDNTFDTSPHWQLLRDLLTATFATPQSHPKSKPFVDHVMSFYIADGKIWVRNYQIADKADASTIESHARRTGGEQLSSLTEVGPRFVLEPIRVLEGAFGGRTLYASGDYIAPNERIKADKAEYGSKYAERKATEEKRAAHVLAVAPPEELQGSRYGKSLDPSRARDELTEHAIDPDGVEAKQKERNQALSAREAAAAAATAAVVARAGKRASKKGKLDSSDDEASSDDDMDDSDDE